MRLSDVLSMPPKNDYEQIEGFLDNKKLSTGVLRNINIGNIGINFFCKKCNNTRTFICDKKIQAIGINKNLISIDCVLQCPVCNETVPVWFLVESQDDIYSYTPMVRVIKYSNRLSEKVCVQQTFLKYAEMLDKAEKAYREGLGAGSAIYLRKLFEIITVEMAQIKNVNTKKESGKRKSFQDLLKEVDSVANIIPQEFSANGYTLFSELSNVLHSNYPEKDALEKYEALQRLIVGILDNIKNNSEIMSAISRLGWN